MGRSTAHMANRIGVASAYCSKASNVSSSCWNDFKMLANSTTVGMGDMVPLDENSQSGWRSGDLKEAQSQYCN